MKNIFDGIEVIERTRFSLEKISKGRKSTKIVDGVKILVLFLI